MQQITNQRDLTPQFFQGGCPRCSRMLHAFTKKSAKTSRRDISIAANRLKAVRARLLEEKHDARKDD